MTNRVEQIAVVVGRNRRVYSRSYKKENSIREFALYCFEKERTKSEREGFVPVSLDEKKPDETTWVFHIGYEAVR